MAKKKNHQGPTVTEWIVAISNLITALVAVGTLIVLILTAIK